MTDEYFNISANSNIIANALIRMSAVLKRYHFKSTDIACLSTANTFYNELLKEKWRNILKE